MATAPLVACVPPNASVRVEEAALSDQLLVEIAEAFVVDAVVNVKVACVYEVAPLVAIVTGVALVSPYALSVKVLPRQSLATFESATVVKLNPPPPAALANETDGDAVIDESQADVSATP